MSGRLEWLGSLPLEEAEEQLLTCCASRQWAHKMVANRPYANAAALLEAAAAGIAELAWTDVEQALSAHPRIGEREAARTEALSEQEAAWSRQEQSGAATADAGVQAELVAGNLAYEERFGHVFLIRATGRTADEVLNALQLRLHNTVEDEQAVVRAELTEIAELRIRKLLGLI